MSFAKILKWLLALAILAILTGSAAALFLWSLDTATHTRFANPWLIYLLPLAGAAMGFYYRYHGKHISSGNHVILGKVHKEKATIPFSLAPSILIATVATHLFGGSAGREGTAVQMGAGIAATVGRFSTTGKASMNLMIFCGIAAGFGAVFGTPFAGAIFALEFTGHRLTSFKLIPCLIAAIAADQVCLAWGITHTPYPAIEFSKNITNYLPLLWKLFFAAVIFALASRFFVMASHLAARKMRQWFPHEAIRAAVGGLAIVGLFIALGTTDYLGLGTLAENESSLTLPRMLNSELRVPADAWFWKTVFTIITLSAGFKGGEVTPLFFIGAATGNALAWFLNAPVDLFAAVGMIAFFAAATKTPWASLIMGIELLGWHLYAPIAICTFATWKMSGKNSVYPDVEDL